MVVILLVANGFCKRDQYSIQEIWGIHVPVLITLDLGPDLDGLKHHPELQAPHPPVIMVSARAQGQGQGQR